MRVFKLLSFWTTLKKLMKLVKIQGNKPNLICVAVPLFGGVSDVWPAEVSIREH